MWSKCGVTLSVANFYILEACVTVQIFVWACQNNSAVLARKLRSIY